MPLGIYLVQSFSSSEALSVSDGVVTEPMAGQLGRDTCSLRAQSESPSKLPGSPVKANGWRALCINANLSPVLFYTTGFIDAVSTVNAVVFLFKKKSSFL